METVKDWIRRYNNQEFNDNSFETQVEAGWYEWFCEQEELLPKLNKMAEIITGIKNEYILNHYEVKFYNRYPINYPLYDEILLKHLDAKEEYFLSIKIDSPYSKNKYILEYWIIENKKIWSFDNKETLLEFINDLK